MASVFNAKIHKELFHFEQDFDLFPPSEQEALPINFIWSDYDECCDYFREKIKSNEALAKLKEEKLKEISHLKNIPVWMRKGTKLFTTNLFDIYENHIQKKSVWNNDPTLPMDISFISPSGPFKKMAITDCLNIQNYQDFVFLSLLDNTLPSREFRLRLHSRLLLEAGQNFEHTLLAELCQVTGRGLLLKFQGNDYFHKLSDASQLRLLLSTQILETTRDCESWSQVKDLVKDWPAHPLYTQNKAESFLLAPSALQLSQRFDYGRTLEVYAFVPFSHLSESNQLMVKRLERFLAHMKHCVLQSLARKTA